MVAVRMNEKTQEEQNRDQRRNQIRFSARLAALVACVFMGFYGVRYWQNKNDRDLLSDLPVIEYVDLYAEVDDLAFLERRDRQLGTFVPVVQVDLHTFVGQARLAQHRQFAQILRVEIVAFGIAQIAPGPVLGGGNHDAPRVPAAHSKLHRVGFPLSS